MKRNHLSQFNGRSRHVLERVNEAIRSIQETKGGPLEIVEVEQSSGCSVEKRRGFHFLLKVTAQMLKGVTPGPVEIGLQAVCATDQGNWQAHHRRYGGDLIPRVVISLNEAIEVVKRKILHCLYQVCNSIRRQAESMAHRRRTRRWKRQLGIIRPNNSEPPFLRTTSSAIAGRIHRYAAT